VTFFKRDEVSRHSAFFSGLPLLENICGNKTWINMAVENRLFHWRCERRNIIKHHQTKWGANANKNQQKDPLCGIFQDSWQEFLTANPTSKQLTFQGPQKIHLSGDLVQHKAGAKRLDEKFQTAWCLVMAQ